MGQDHKNEPPKEEGGKMQNTREFDYIGQIKKMLAIRLIMLTIIVVIVIEIVAV